MLNNNGKNIATYSLIGTIAVGEKEDYEALSPRKLILKNPLGKVFCTNDKGDSNYVSTLINRITKYTYSNEKFVATNLTPNNSDISTDNMTTSNSCQYVLFIGSGCTAPTVEDLRLENCITNYTRVEEGTYIDTINNKYVVYMDIRTGNESIEINEVGCYFSPYVQYTYKPLVEVVALIGRKVLDNPITIEPHDEVRISYELFF